MAIASQLVIFALIVTSSILLISVPVVFASSDGWSSNKNIVFFGTSLWIRLVFLIVSLILSFLELLWHFFDQKTPFFLKNLDCEIN